MPLSEEEQRILRQIEEQFHQDDPKLAQTVAKSSVYNHAGHQLTLAIAGVVAGLGLMVAFLAFGSIGLSLVGFVVAFGSAVAALYAFKRMTQAGLNDLRRKTRHLFERDLDAPEGGVRRRLRDTDDL